MSAGDALNRKRWGGGGLLLAALLAILLVAPLLRHRDTNHPLAATQRTDLCPLLPPPPRELQYPRGAPRAGPGAAYSATCEYKDERDQLVLSIALSSTRQLSQGGAADTQKMFETWMKEVRASYGNGTDLAGAWRHGGTWKGGDRQSLIFEDGGVLVFLESARLDAGALAAHAGLVQASLREAERD